MSAASNTRSSCHHYLPVTDDLLRNGVYVTSAGRDRIKAGAPYPSAQHPSLYHFNWATGRTLPEFGLLLVTRGRGIFESRATGKKALGDGSAIVLFPGVWHRYRPDPEVGWTEKWVQFNGAFIHGLLRQNLIDPERGVLRPAEPRAVAASLDRLIDAVHRDPMTNSVHLSLLALSTLALALDHPLAPPPVKAAPSPGESASDPLVAAALDYIWTRSHEVLSVSRVAEAVGTTRRTLERRMFAAGRSVLEEIILCRFSRAERLVRETDLPVKTIVDLAGFGSLENLRHAFVARTSQSPSAYRARHRSAPS